MHPNVHHWFNPLWGEKKISIEILMAKDWLHSPSSASLMYLHLHLSYVFNQQLSSVLVFFYAAFKRGSISVVNSTDTLSLWIKTTWHHLLFAVQLNRLIRANKEQLWHQHLSSSSFSVDLSCYIDLSKKSQGCHAAWRVNQAFDRLTSFLKKLAHHKANFTADLLVYTPNLPKVSLPILGL